MRDHNYHYDDYHRRKPFPIGCLVIGLILLIVFGSKLMLCVPFVIFFLIMGGCFGGGKRRRTVEVPYYYGDSYDRKRKNDFDDEDDITYV